MGYSRNFAPMVALININSVYLLTFYHTIPSFDDPEEDKHIESIVRKGENAAACI